MSWERYNSFDFGDQIQVQKGNKLYLKALPEDLLSDVLYYEVEKHPGYFTITQVNDAPEETYSNGVTVIMPARILSNVMVWWARS